MCSRLAELFVTHGVPAHILRHGPEFTAELIRFWLEVQVQTLFIEPGSPWENGYVESFLNWTAHADGSPDLDREMAAAVQHGATAQCAGLSTPNAQGGRADTDWRVDHELSSLIKTGTTTGGRSVAECSRTKHMVAPRR